MDLTDILIDITKRLNTAGIDYYIVGAVGAYLDARMPFVREHDDLDILINERDVSKLASIFAKTNFAFHDNRKTSSKTLNQAGYTDGDHEVYAEHQDLKFHIGFFLFYRGESTYTIVEYYRDNNVQRKLERTLPIEFFELQYNMQPIIFHGVPIKTVRKETIYKNKTAMHRNKDRFDQEQLAPKINQQILGQLSGMHRHRITKTSDI